MAAKRVASAKPKSFTDLPAEIRNLIYELTLTSDHPISLQRTYDTHGPIRQKFSQFIDYHHGVCVTRSYKRAHLVPNLVLLNRATYAEAAPVLYANDFHFGECIDVHTFLRRLRPSTISYITNITLINLELVWNNYPASYTGPTFQLLARASRLSSFRIENLNPWDHCKVRHIAALILSYGSSWLQAMAISRGSLQEAVKIIRFNESFAYNHGTLEDRDLCLMGQDSSLEKRMREAMVKSFQDYIRIRLVASGWWPWPWCREIWSLRRGARMHSKCWKRES